MKKILSFATIILAACQLSFAEDVATLRARATKSSQTLPQGVTLEGIVISDCYSTNTEYNPQIAFNRVDLGLSLKTAYIESEDGALGVKIVFENVYANRLHRGDKVSIRLDGCVLSLEKDPDRYTVSGVAKSSVSILSSGNALPEKQKSISQIDDSDLYTFVTVKDVEFLAKQGSFSNIYEGSAQKLNRMNSMDNPIKAGDAWAQLLEDCQGRHIYMQINSTCRWRRDNLGVPQGVGPVSGVIVSNENRRYGGDIGRYSIRPMFREDIAIPEEKASSFTTVVSWRWDRNYYQALNFRDHGTVRWVPKKTYSGDAVLADEGKGELYTDTDATMHLDVEYDARHCTDASGLGGRAGGALRFEADPQRWFDGGSVIIKSSTLGFSGNGLIFNFSWVAGNQSVGYSWGYPAEWLVAYSTDGKSWTEIDRRFYLRPIVFAPGNVKGIDGEIVTSYDAAMGFTEYSVNLPSSLLGQKDVYVKITPASRLISTLNLDPDAPIVQLRSELGMASNFAFRLGMAVLKTF
ncbi:MAG: DUF5689 domain-containing protein [Bacteroidales bacterium]|nr:DUF5689 domain-containing protein [Bacteroidales bacterium]